MAYKLHTLHLDSSSGCCSLVCLWRYFFYPLRSSAVCSIAVTEKEKKYIYIYIYLCGHGCRHLCDVVVWFSSGISPSYRNRKQHLPSDSDGCASSSVKIFILWLLQQHPHTPICTSNNCCPYTNQAAAVRFSSSCAREGAFSSVASLS